MTEADGQGNLKDVIRPTVPVEQPEVPQKLCSGCGTMLDESLQKTGAKTHPNCDRKVLKFNHPDPVKPGTDHPMRTQLIELIRWADRTSARSTQVAIGPSEIGTSCDRRLGYRLANAKTINRFSDPWPAIVGTAMHDWLQRCLERDNANRRAKGLPARWITEHRVQIDPLVVGKTDAYDTTTCTVVDWKSMGDTARRRLEEQGPSEGYIKQIQMYGLGFYRAGYRVDRVALMFLPRAGKLKDARYYEWPFDPAVAQQAIARMYAVGSQVITLRQRGGTEEIWDRVAADPTQLCGWCPYFSRGADQATSQGCPGR